MAALACNIASLLSAAQCLLCLSETELLAAEVLLREQLRADAEGNAVRPLDELLRQAEVWNRLTEHQKQAIEVRQLCNDAVDAGARTSCEASALKEETKCYCQYPQSQLQGVISYLKCVDRQS